MKQLKRTALVLLALLLVALAAGCKRSNVAPNLGPALDTWQEHGKAPSYAAGEPAEITPVENGDFGPALGFELTGLPATDSLSPTSYYAIDYFAQIEYQAPALAAGGDARVLVVRVAPSSAGRLASVYNESHLASDETLEIAGLEVRVQDSSEGCQLASWQRGDFQYTVHSNKKQGAIPADELEALAAGLDAASLAA